MDALERQKAATQKAQQLRDARENAAKAARLEEQRRLPIHRAWEQIYQPIPCRYDVNYHLCPYEEWAENFADRICEFVSAVETAGYSERIAFMTHVIDLNENDRRSWDYVHIAQANGRVALLQLIQDSIPPGNKSKDRESATSEPLDPCWWAAFNSDLPSQHFFSDLTVSDLTCPSCKNPRSVHAAKEGRSCDTCRSTIGTMAQAVEAWDMRTRYREETPSFRTPEVKRLILAAAQVVHAERKKRPEIRLMEKTNARRAIWLLAERLKISANEAYEFSIAKAMAEFENWNSPLASPVVEATNAVTRAMESAVANESPQAVTTAQPEGSKVPNPRKPKASKRKETATDGIKRLVREFGESVLGWSSAQFSQQIGCSDKAIRNSVGWKQLRKQKNRSQAAAINKAKQPDRHRDLRRAND